MITIGILGYGYWGPNLVRNFISIGCNVKRVVDLNLNRLEVVNSLYPQIQTSCDVEDVFSDSEINAVIIALPVNFHYPMAKRALLAGKHVLVEKPLTSSSESAEDLIQIADSKSLILMVDHTFLYTGAVRKIKELVDANEIGKLQYFDSTRINLGLFQTDINVIWDLAPHDISIIKFITGKEPNRIVVTGKAHTESGIENIAYMALFYDDDDFIAHVNVSWISPVKIRSMLIGGDKKMIVYNDNEPSEKIKIYNSGYTVSKTEDLHKLRIDYRLGDIYIPKLVSIEALKEMASDFVNSIKTGQKPISDAQLGLSVVKILEAAQKSIKNNGLEVII